MQDALFYIFAALTLLCGFLVIANPFSRNPVTSAMFLVLTIASMAGLFIQLHAYFLGAVQILVYAGAVMVLFLFVIMLLDVPEEDRRKINLYGIITALIAVGAFAGLVIRAIVRTKFTPVAGPLAVGDPAPLGRLLFSQYVLPFEILSVLLLAAMIGVILLSKKDLK